MLLENKHPGLQFRHLSPRKGGELMLPYKVLQRLFVERPQFLILVISEFFLKQKKWVLAIMPKISEISVLIQMERSVSVSSHRNIRDGITSGCGPLISVGIFRPKFAVPFLTNRFFALMRKFGKRIKNDKTHSFWLARFNRKMSFHFPWIFPLISDWSVWHNGKHPRSQWS